MPVIYQGFGERWLALNPGWQLRDWTQEEIFDTKWANQDVIDQMIKESKQSGADLKAFYTHVADVVDYELVYEFGGWYFNTDIMPIRPLSNLDGYDLTKPAAGMEDDYWPVNAAMWAPEVHMSFWRQCIEELPKRYFSNPGAFMNYTTGPHLLKTIVDRNPGGITLLPRNIFNPIHWSEFNYGSMPEYEREYPPETVATHIWEHRTSQRGQRILENW